jgi:hypothetical protein
LKIIESENEVCFFLQTEQEIKFNKWKFAVKKCLNWEVGDDVNVNYFAYEEKGRCTCTNFLNLKTIIHYFPLEPQQYVKDSIPGGIFLFTSFALLLAAQILQTSS